MSLTLQQNTISTPAKEEKLYIRYKPATNMIVAKGRSTGLEVVPAYTKLIEIVKSHFKNANRLTAYFNYTVLNASTTKILFSLFKELSKASHNGHKVTVFWIIEEGDEELLDIGLDFKNMLNLDFQIVVR